jgi:putative pyruvate formate lyase activating enzyme
VIDELGMARRGLLIRRLVLPEELSGTEKILAFIAKEIPPNTYVNIMGQYYPCYRADEYPTLNRRMSDEEIAAELKLAQKYNLHRPDRSNDCEKYSSA